MEQTFAEALITLNAILRYHTANFQLLHWNSSGENFDDAHVKIAEDYYTLCESYIDPTAEMVARLDYFVCGYSEVATAADEEKWTTVAADKLVDRSQVIKTSAELLSEINDAIIACLDCEAASLNENAGIRSELENMQNEFDLQIRYINSRRAK